MRIIYDDGTAGPLRLRDGLSALLLLGSLAVVLATMAGAL